MFGCSCKVVNQVGWYLKKKHDGKFGKRKPYEKAHLQMNQKLKQGDNTNQIHKTAPEQILLGMLSEERKQCVCICCWWIKNKVQQITDKSSILWQRHLSTLPGTDAAQPTLQVGSSRFSSFAACFDEEGEPMFIIQRALYKHKKCTDPIGRVKCNLCLSLNVMEPFEFQKWITVQFWCIAYF